MNNQQEDIQSLHKALKVLVNKKVDIDKLSFLLDNFFTVDAAFKYNVIKESGKSLTREEVELLKNIFCQFREEGEN